MKLLTGKNLTSEDCGSEDVATVCVYMRSSAYRINIIKQQSNLDLLEQSVLYVRSQKRSKTLLK